MTKIIVAFRNFPNVPEYDTDPRKSTILELLIDFWRNAMTYLLPENATLSCASEFRFRRSPQAVCSAVTQ
jgi:hypothetical protein